MKGKIILLLFLSILGLSGNVLSQEPKDTSLFVMGENYVVILQDGTEYIGILLADNGHEVLVRTEDLGNIYIPKYLIREIRQVEISEEVVFGELRTIGPFTTRYYFTNNAYPIKRGENYALMHLYGPEVHFALTDRFSLGVMSTWIASPIALAAKYSIPSRNEKVKFSLGTIMGSSGYLLNARGYGGLHWFSVTTGKRGSNMTFSAGYAYVKTGVVDEVYNETTGMFEEREEDLVKAPMLSIAGITTVSSRASFIFDSMFALSKHDMTTYPNEQYLYEYDSMGNIINEIYVPGDAVISSGYRVTALIMPGMRFQKSSKRAFQIALAGIFQWDEVGYENRDFGEGRFRSIPFPMMTWFFKF